MRYYNKSTGIFQEYSSTNKEFTTLRPGISYYLYTLKDTTWTITNTNIPATTTFVYDGDGGRVAKRIAQGAQRLEETTYIGSLYEERIAQSEERIAVKHIFAGANRVCSIVDSEAHYFHSDHLGSSNVITYQNSSDPNDKNNGKQVALTEFTPYGSTFKQTGTYDPKHKFTGKELDASTGLYFYGVRYYDPELGRFITADPTVQRPYDSQDLNRYSYCRNNPINYVDPSGLGWKDFWGKVSGFFGAIIGTAVGVVTGNPLIGMAIYNAIAASGTRNFAQAFRVGMISGTIGLGFGSIFSGMGGLGAFLGTTFGGAAAGATTAAALLGGDVGLGALSGGVGSATGFIGGLPSAGLGNIIGGMAGEAVAGGDIGEGALQGMAMNLGLYFGGNMIPDYTGTELVGKLQAGDILYEKGRLGPLSPIMALFDPGPFSHTAIMVSATEIADSHPGSRYSGPNVQKFKEHPVFNQRWAVVRTGNSKLGTTARSLVTAMQREGYVFGGWKFGGEGKTVFCSPFAGKVYGEAGISGIWGIGPNTQYYQWRMRSK